MVFYFTSDVVSPVYTLYMGLDKHENEDLIKWGWPEDIWFHVDKVSSAHVYLRLHPNETIEDLSESVIQDCAQLVKANSIQGNKMNNVDVVYTQWANLKKTAGMDVGQVSFFKQKQVRSYRVEKRLNEVVNRLNKTKEERKVDFRGEREERDRVERESAKATQRQQQREERDEVDKRAQAAELRSYSSLMDEDNMTSNEINDGNDSDDFM